MKDIASRIVLLTTSLMVAGLASVHAASLSGKVTETMDSGGYTYVQVDTGSNQVWAAASRFPVKTGDVVTFSDAMPMKSFHSDSLKRDFALIYFVEDISVAGSVAAGTKLPLGHPDVGTMPAGHPKKAPGMTVKPKLDFSDLKPLKDGTVVASIYADKKKLAGKTVKLRGKVVKYNAGILGKNWVHVQDGTGEAGSNDLLITTQDTTKVGATVVVEGKVALDQDFGSNYKYEVLLEESKLTAE
ncbi:MAG: nucleotide-binding protein [Verrucomicrobiota bacterium]